MLEYKGVKYNITDEPNLNGKGIGIELKDSYYKQAILNLKEADKRFKNVVTKSLFD